MTRTTLNIDDPVLDELKRLKEREGRPLGRLVSELLARALAERREAPASPGAFSWESRPMGARVDLRDKERVLSILDRENDGGA